MNRHLVSVRGGQTCFLLYFYAVLRQISSYFFGDKSLWEHSVCDIFYPFFPTMDPNPFFGIDINSLLSSNAPILIFLYVMVGFEFLKCQLATNGLSCWSGGLKSEVLDECRKVCFWSAILQNLMYQIIHVYMSAYITV